MPSIWLLSALLINFRVNQFIVTNSKENNLNNCQGLQTPIPLRVTTSCFPSTSTWKSTICGWWWWCIELCLTNPFHFFCFHCLIANHFIFKKCLIFLVKVNLANTSFLFKCILHENCDLVALDAI